VIQNVPPPTRDNDPAYRFNPSTINTTQQLATLISSPGTVVDGVKKYAYIWGNRCHPTPTTSSDCADTILKGNAVQTYPHNIGYEAFFTSRAKADACTIAQGEGHAGASRTTILSQLQAVGLKLADTEAAMVTASDALSTSAQRSAFVGGSTALAGYMKWPLNASRPWIADTCYIPEVATVGAPNTGAHITGIVLDYENADNRTPAQAIQFLQSLTSSIRATKPGIKLIMFNDDMMGVNTKWSGLDSISGPTALSLFDMVAIWAWPGGICQYRAAPIATHLDAQLYELNGNRTTSVNNHKIYVVYSLRNDEDITSDVRSYILSNGIGGVMFFRDNSVQDTCDVTKVTPARHIMHMLNLPTPQSTAGTSTTPEAQGDIGADVFDTPATNDSTPGADGPVITPVAPLPVPETITQPMQTQVADAKTPKYLFDHDLLLGVGDGDVVRLQVFLNQHGFVVTSNGTGSPGNESTYFGPLTQAALIRYQMARQIVPSVGYFGPKTRQVMNAEL